MLESRLAGLGTERVVSALGQRAWDAHKRRHGEEGARSHGLDEVLVRAGSVNIHVPSGASARRMWRAARTRVTQFVQHIEHADEVVTLAAEGIGASDLERHLVADPGLRGLPARRLNRTGVRIEADERRAG